MFSVRSKTRTLAALACVTLAIGGYAGCAARDHQPSPAPQLALPTPSGSAAAPAAPAKPASAAPSPQQPTLLITDSKTLAALERQGLTLARVLGAPGDLGNRELSQLPGFAVLVRELEQEAARAAAADKLAGVDVARFSHRLFDRRFLRLPQARFKLAGVVNRPDRAPFDATSCGETRLIYRLSYALDAERASKLPMTLGIELKVPRGAAGCREAAARWLEPASTGADTNAIAEARASWLRSEQGPLTPALVRVATDSARVVVNLQLVRWPATIRPDLGGHAEYLLRSFRPDAAGLLKPERLENTVDARELAGPPKRAALLAFLNEQAISVDAGTPLLPDALLATRAVSVTPRGLNRLANRPFSAALDVKALAERDFSAGAFVKSPRGLLRRLDQLSCQGCHQARSVAGFHLLGEDLAEAPAENALAIAVSPHVTADLPRRLRIAQDMLASKAPDFSAPFAEHGAPQGSYGQACALGQDPSFASWICPAGLICSSIEAGSRDPVGQCLPSVPRVGDACERGAVTPRADFLRDRMSGVKAESCPDMICNRSGVGFPGGMCTADCNAPGAACGAIAILDPFNACLGRGNSFLSCIRGNVQPAGLRACDEQNPCRDDYVCARTKSGGACLPPYFVFQLRVDGHSVGLR
jgi:hypothetical protein